MNAPVATERKSFLPTRLPSKAIIEPSSITIVHRKTTAVAPPMPSVVQNDVKSLFKVGDRVLINGLKKGTICYTGLVKFAEGIFCGIELDDPDGKHDGQVNNIRYFKCKVNHGIFVPQDKVVLVPRDQMTPTPRTISRLQPPKMSRSLTLPSSINKKLEPVRIQPSPTSNHLPDLVVNTSTLIQPTKINEIIHESTPSDTDNHKIITQPTIETKTILETPLLPHDEGLESDFTESVSLVLHQLQQEQTSFFSQPYMSMTTSEDGTMDDEDEEDDNTDADEFDSESISESIPSKPVQPTPPAPLKQDSAKSIQTDLSFDAKDNITFMKNSLLNSKPLSMSNRSLTGSIKSITKPKTSIQDNKVNTQVKKPSIIPSPAPIVKKEFERKLSTPQINASNAIRRGSLIPPKKPPPSSSMNRLNSTSSLNWKGSQSKISVSISPSNSTTSIQSDFSSSHTNISKIASRPTSVVFRPNAHSVDHSFNKKPNQTRYSLDVTDNQSAIQKLICQSLEVANERLKKQYQQLSQQFDVMLILSQHYITENEQIKQQYQFNLSKAKKAHDKLKIFVDELQATHKTKLTLLNEQCQNQIKTIRDTSNEKCLEYQRQIDKLLHEKIELETRSASLQEKVDKFMEEMENSEHADPLLRHVETLEKDKASLQTVLEMRNQELTQLRTKINEQVFQREDQLALQRRIDMAENRNQDLVFLLRNWQLNEKAAIVERDRLKEQVAQLERDNQQLTFENETLIYSLRQRSLSISIAEPQRTTYLISRPIRKLGQRAKSFASIFPNINEHDKKRIRRSLSLNCISNR